MNPLKLYCLLLSLCLYLECQVDAFSASGSQVRVAETSPSEVSRTSRSPPGLLFDQSENGSTAFPKPFDGDISSGINYFSSYSLLALVLSKGKLTNQFTFQNDATCVCVIHNANVVYAFTQYLVWGDW